jgi:surface protein
MNKFLLTLLCIACTNMLFATDFITRWDMNKPGGSPTAITFGVGTTGNVSYTWETVPAGSSGAGTFSGSTATITGIPTNSIIRLHIDTANFNRININNGIDKRRLVDVEQWGNVAWTSMQNAFYGCNNLNITSIDFPNLNLVNNMNRMFHTCSILNGPMNINNWNTSNITNMFEMFKNATIFNQPIGNWNTANVTNMSGMFLSASNFNQPIGNWNTANVTDMNGIFGYASNFNQPIGGWNTGNVLNMTAMFYYASNFDQPIGGWNTANVSSMQNMFYYAVNFNQPIGNWNTANVTNMSGMFGYAVNFNQPIGNWNTANVTNMSGMFSYTYSFN